ncbi:MAG: hypothetical protein ACTSRF_16395 [Candidatus Freyarchaeota archaeon]
MSLNGIFSRPRDECRSISGSGMFLMKNRLTSPRPTAEAKITE